jgi:hypothetical protein
MTLQRILVGKTHQRSAADMIAGGKEQAAPRSLGVEEAVFAINQVTGSPQTD